MYKGKTYALGCIIVIIAIIATCLAIGLSYDANAEIINPYEQYQIEEEELPIELEKEPDILKEICQHSTTRQETTYDYIDENTHGCKVTTYCADDCGIELSAISGTAPHSYSEGVCICGDTCSHIEVIYSPWYIIDDNQNYRDCQCVKCRMMWKEYHTHNFTMTYYAVVDAYYHNYIKSCSCGSIKVIKESHNYGDWIIYGNGIDCYDQYRDCKNCGRRQAEHIPHVESDWSDWKFEFYVTLGNEVKEYWSRSNTTGGITVTDYEFREHTDHDYKFTSRNGACCKGEDMYLSYEDTYTCSICSDKITKYSAVPESDMTDWEFDCYVKSGNTVKERWTRSCKSVGGSEYEYRSHSHSYSDDYEVTDRVYTEDKDSYCYQEAQIHECDCGAKKTVYKNYRHEWQCTDYHNGIYTYTCANCDCEYTKGEYIEEDGAFYEKYYDRETRISYYENEYGEYYYRYLIKGEGYIYAASFEELYVLTTGKEYDPEYFKKYYPHALTVKTGTYVCPEN